MFGIAKRLIALALLLGMMPLASGCAHEEAEKTAPGTPPIAVRTPSNSISESGTTPEPIGQTPTPDKPLTPSPSAEAAPMTPADAGKEMMPLKGEINAALESNRFVFVLFYRGCAPCKLSSLLKILNEMETTYGDRIVFLRTDDPTATEAFGVITSPTMLLITGRQNGEYTEYARIEGTTDRATLEDIFIRALSE